QRGGKERRDIECNPAQQKAVEQTAAPKQDQPRHRLPAEHSKEDPIRSGRARTKLQHQIGYDREADDARETDRRSDIQYRWPPAMSSRGTGRVPIADQDI